MVSRRAGPNDGRVASRGALCGAPQPIMHGQMAVHNAHNVDVLHVLISMLTWQWGC